MSRFTALIRPLIRQNRQIPSRSTSRTALLISPRNITHVPSSPFTSVSISAAACLFSGCRTFSSASASDSPSNMVIVKTEDQFSDSLQKVTDESFPAIFYFTAAWCGPCRFLWPDIKKLSESLPGVKFYKIDIDDVGSGPTIEKFLISSVPTLHFFKDGKKAAEVVGADPKKIRDITSSLYEDK